MRRIIPGHVRAHTVWITIALSITVYVETHRWFSVLGVVLLTAGMFLGDQAVHLAQMDHGGPPPTWIERQQQKYPKMFVLLGFLLGAAGITIILFRFAES